MSIDINRIVAAGRLKLDAKLILDSIEGKGSVIVFDNNEPQFAIVELDAYLSKSTASEPVGVSKGEQPALKIGQFVQDTMRKLFHESILTEKEISCLCDLNYSNETFGLNFAVLRLYDPSVPFDEQKRDARGYNRYYSFLLPAFNQQYLLCSQWVDKLHREKYEAWLAEWI